MENYRVIIKGRALYQSHIQTIREALKVKQEAQLYYPTHEVDIESYYLPVPEIKETK